MTIKDIEEYKKKRIFDMKKVLLLAASCATISLATAPAMAQSIDYGTMEEMFGEPVTTSATGKPQRMSEVPVTMEILTAEDIRRSGAVDLPEVLRQVNGVNVLQNSSHSYDVSIRGYNQGFSQRLLVLVNGRQVYLDHYGYTSWSTIPVQLEEIRQIEVVKGPNTALFGFNAVSGVINIVTYNPLYDNESSAGVTVGTNDYRHAHYVQSMKLTDKLGVRLSAGKREANSFDSNTNGITTMTNTTLNKNLQVDPEQESLNLDAMYQITDKSQLRMEISGSNALQSEYVSNGSVMRSDYETKAAKLSYEVDSDVGLIKASLYRNILDWSPTMGIEATAIKIKNTVTVAQLEDTIQLNDAHTLRLSAEYRKNEMEGETIIASDAEVSYDVYALGGMWSWNINDKLSWTNAVRVDFLELTHNDGFTSGSPYTVADYDNDVTEYSYNSGLVFKATEEDTLRLSTSRGLEVPSLLEYAIDLPLGAVTAVGNPDLDAAVVTNYELAWDHKIDAIEDGLFRTAVFYQDSKDLKTMQNNINGTLLETGNLGDSSSYGLELGLEGSVDQKFTWGLGYIYQKIKDDMTNKTAGVLTTAKEYEDSNPQHQVKLKLGYQNGSWEADTLAYYVSETDQVSWAGGGLPQDNVDAYIGLNARVGYTFDNDVTLAVSGMNAQSSDTQTTPAPDIERRVFVSLSKKF